MIPLIDLRREQDEELVRRLQRGDPHAMTPLYDRLARVIYSVILAIVRDAGVTEELVQETFMRVWTGVHAVKLNRGTFRPWVLTVARNRALDYMRARHTRIEGNNYDFDGLQHPSLFADPEHEVLEREHVRVVRKALEGLNARQRKVIDLAFYEELSQSEMAVKLGEPLGTVKSRARDALKHLRASACRTGLSR